MNRCTFIYLSQYPHRIISLAVFGDGDKNKRNEVTSFCCSVFYYITLLRVPPPPEAAWVVVTALTTRLTHTPVHREKKLVLPFSSYLGFSSSLHCCLPHIFPFPSLSLPHAQDAGAGKAGVKWSVPVGVIAPLTCTTNTHIALTSFLRNGACLGGASETHLEGNGAVRQESSFSTIFSRLERKAGIVHEKTG